MASAAREETIILRLTLNEADKLIEALGLLPEDDPTDPIFKALEHAYNEDIYNNKEGAKE